ncbi:hypothetical protein RhiJN_27714 [Ceratobasidium sp. AG-Ba]|nr:hypothetical protein RhiJN_27714 [Ceratobasidium sp. AG-Ba]
MRRFKKAAERREFIGGSFATSKALLEKSSSFTVPHSECLQVLDFKEGWQNPNCSVAKWYKKQQQFCTRFRSIRHLRDMSTAFYHEFLVLDLNDGSCCRVERLGAGSKVDAIRTIGCMANDYIRYFPKGKNSSTPDEHPELVAKIEFLHDIDIIDVLAVCYAIYKPRRTRAYTLQRFNCYFLCNTILMVLTRRLVRWEKELTNDNWRHELHSSLNRLTKKPQTEEPSHLILEVCRLLDPEASVPAAFLYDALGHKLDQDPAVYESLQRALSGTLWRSSWRDCMKLALARHVKDSVLEAIEGDSNGATAFKLAASSKKQHLQRDFKSYDFVNKITDKKATTALADGLTRLLDATNEQYRMEKMEHPHHFLKGLWIQLASHTMGALFPVHLLFQGEMEEWGFKHIFLGSFKGLSIAQSTGVFMSRRLIGMAPAPDGQPIMVRGMQLDTTATSTPPVARANYTMAAQTLRETLAELKVLGCISIENITIALHGILCKNIWDAWLNQAVGDLLDSELPDMVKDRGEGISVSVYQKGEFSEKITNVIQYQDYIMGRIREHAKRVQDFHLAAEPLVVQDIHAAMTDVWMSMPPEFTKPATREQ